MAYQASKRGMVALAHATMIEERQHGIRVSVVYPGLCDTPLLNLRKTPPSPEKLAKALKPEHVAAACVFLAGLPAPVYVPELPIASAELQCLGQLID